MVALLHIPLLRRRPGRACQPSVPESGPGQGGRGAQDTSPTPPTFPLFAVSDATRDNASALASQWRARARAEAGARLRKCRAAVLAHRGRHEKRPCRCMKQEPVRARAGPFPAGEHLRLSWRVFRFGPKRGSTSGPLPHASPFPAPILQFLEPFCESAPLDDAPIPLDAPTECPSSRTSSGPRTGRGPLPRPASTATMRSPSQSPSRAGRSRGRAKTWRPRRSRS